VVEKNSVDEEHVVGFAVVDQDPVGVLEEGNTGEGKA
jgi:hypothetical protein